MKKEPRGSFDDLMLEFSKSRIEDFLNQVKLINGRDGYTPVKGKDYFTSEEIKTIINYVLDKATPVKGIDFHDGEDGEDGKDAEVDYEAIIEYVLSALPKQKKEETITETAKSIVEKINSVKGAINADSIKGMLTVDDVIRELKDPKSKNRLDKKDITGINMNDQRWHGGGSGSALAVTDGITTVTPTKKITFTGATVSDLGSGNAGVDITGGTGGSMEVQAVSGTIDGVNVTFTFPTAFSGSSIISLAGQIFVEGAEYTVSGTTITFVTAPSAGYAGSTFYIISGAGTGGSGGGSAKPIEIRLTGGASTVSVGQYINDIAPAAATINSYILMSDQICSAVLNVGKTTVAGYAASTTLTSICAAAKPTLTAARIIASSTLTGWNTTVNLKDIYGVTVESNDVATQFILYLFVS